MNVPGSSILQKCQFSPKLIDRLNATSVKVSELVSVHPQADCKIYTAIQHAKHRQANVEYKKQNKKTYATGCQDLS